MKLPQRIQQGRLLINGKGFELSGYALSVFLHRGQRVVGMGTSFTSMGRMASVRSFSRAGASGLVASFTAMTPRSLYQLRRID
jgi:hypothetical protein